MYLFHADSAKIIYLKKYPVPLEIEWWPPKNDNKLYKRATSSPLFYK